MKGYQFSGVSILDLIPKVILKMLQDFVLTDMDADNQLSYLNDCDYEFHISGCCRDKTIIRFSTSKRYKPEELYAILSVYHVTGEDFIIRLPYQSVYGTFYVRNSEDNIPKSRRFDVIRKFDVIKLILYLLTNFNNEQTDIIVTGIHGSFSCNHPLDLYQLIVEYIKIISIDGFSNNQSDDLKLLFDKCLHNVCANGDIIEYIVDACNFTWLHGFVVLHDILPDIWHYAIQNWLDRYGIGKVIDICQQENQFELLMLIMRETKDSSNEEQRLRL